MVVSSRLLIAMGLGLVGVGLLVTSSLGQDADNSVRKAAARPTVAASPTAPSFGWIDMGLVFKNYEKVKVISEEFQSAVMNKRNEIMKYAQEMQQESEILSKMTPGSVDFKKHESRISELKAKAEVEREQAERDFSLREAEMMATIYKEIQAMVGRVAKHKGLNYVLRVSNDPIRSSDPRSAMTAIERTVVYAEPGSDITQTVVLNLNREYKAAGGAAPQPAAPAAPAAASTGTRPRGN